MILRTNFKPLKITKHGPGDVELKTEVTKRRGSFFVQIPAKEYSRSRGGIIIHSGLGPTTESISTEVLQIAVSAGQANVDVELKVDLPDGYVPESVSPAPDRMIGFDGIKLFWEGNNKFGRSAPVFSGAPGSVLGQNDRGRLEDIAVQLRYSNPRLKRLESSLLFFFSALFGVGFTLVSESVVNRLSGRKKSI